MVIGGANMDYKARLQENARLGECNPGRVDTFFGGVGRNMAENLGRLEVPTSFLGVIGGDAHGQALERQLRELRVSVHGLKTERTSVFMAVVEADGEMMVGVSDMESMEALTPEVVNDHAQSIRKADAIVLDCNLPEATLCHIFETYGEKRLYVDGVSAAKVKKIHPYLSKVHTLKITENEAHALYKEEAAIGEAAEWCLKRGVKRVFVSLGARGFALYDQETSTFVKALKVDVIDTSGAGDALMAGILYADAHQKAPAPYALAASAIAVKSASAVNTDISPTAIESIVKEYANDFN